MPPPRTFILIALAISASLAIAQSPPPKPPVDQLIPWLLNEDRQLRGIPFSEVIFDVTGRKVLPVDRNDEVDQRVIKRIAGGLDEVLKRMNAPESDVQKVGRINEVSSHVEELRAIVLTQSKAKQRRPNGAAPLCLTLTSFRSGTWRKR